MNISKKDIDVLKKLAYEYMEIATLSIQKQKVILWKALNRNQMERPMVVIDQIPWNEFKNDSTLTCKVENVYFREIELTLRQTIYKWKHFPVDMVVEPYITIPKFISDTGYGFDLEIENLALSEDSTAPSQHYNRMLNTYEDIEKIKDRKITVDEEKSTLYFQQAKEIFNGIAPLVQGHGIQFHLGIWDFLTMAIGMKDVYFDLIDNPEYIHACMRRLTDSQISGIKSANKNKLHNDISKTCHCSYVYTDELLPDFNSGKGPLSQNSWAFGMAQLFTSVSPAVTEEFEIPYISEMAKYFGKMYYGCCEKIDDRLDIIKNIPNVAKISCSPWSDRKNFAKNIGSDIIMSNKPTPAFVAEETVNWTEVKKDLEYTINIAKEYNVNLELILKDISTVRDDPKRLTKWAEIAMDLVNNY